MYISSVFYLLSIYGYRLALLLMYLRLFGVSKPFRWATWIVMAFVTGYLFSNFLTLLFGCSPVSKYWRPQEPGHCIDLVKADYAYGSMNVASDALLFLLPLPMVWQLKLSRREKVGLFLIFMSGIAYVVPPTAFVSIRLIGCVKRGLNFFFPAEIAQLLLCASHSWLST